MLVTRNEDGRGLHCEFENGCVLSVQWGPMNYCSNRLSHNKNKKFTSVELAAWEPNNDYIDLPLSNHNVVGYVPIGDVSKYMDFVRGYDLTIVETMV